MNRLSAKFNSPVGASRFGSQNLGFQGRGSLEVGTNSVVFSGKQWRPFWLGRKTMTEVKFSEIVNVERSGKVVDPAGACGQSLGQ